MVFKLLVQPLWMLCILVLLAIGYCMVHQVDLFWQLCSSMLVEFLFNRFGLVLSQQDFGGMILDSLHWLFLMEEVVISFSLDTLVLLQSVPLNGLHIKRNWLVGWLFLVVFIPLLSFWLIKSIIPLIFSLGFSLLIGAGCSLIEIKKSLTHSLLSYMLRFIVLLLTINIKRKWSSNSSKNQLFLENISLSWSGERELKWILVHCVWEFIRQTVNSIYEKVCFRIKIFFQFDIYFRSSLHI